MTAMARTFFVYMMTNAGNTVLYIGVTGDLPTRVWQHRNGHGGFTAHYRLKKLVWWEMYGDPRTAIGREKQLKAGSRARKVALVSGMNPEWRDLYGGL